MPRHERTTKSFADALDFVLNGIEPLHSVQVGAVDAIGLVLAESILASDDSPAFRQAAMDGFGIRAEDAQDASADRPIRLAVVDTLGAGQVRSADIGPGQCVRIMTGAACPATVTAVVPWEVVEEADGKVSLTSPLAVGQNIRGVGEIWQRGSTLLEAGSIVTPAGAGLIASNGLATVSVQPRPQVAIVTIGDELVDPTAVAGRHAIADSNSILVPGLVRVFGGLVCDQRRLPDEPEVVASALLEIAATAPDLIVTVGGAASSERDVPGRIEHESIDLWPMDVRMRPGRPLIAGRVGQTPVIGLPGNPGAAFNSAWQFVQPAIRKLSGHAMLTLPEVLAVCPVPLRDEPGRRTFFRVRLVQQAGRLVAHPAGTQSPADQVSLAATDGLLVLDEQQASVAVGDSVVVQVLNPEAALRALSPGNSTGSAFG